MELYDVFISYRRSDGMQIAEALYTYLTERGLSVFLDREKLEYGYMFPPQLECALQMAPNYVLIATEDVFHFRQGKDWVRKEINLALEKHKADASSGTLTVLVPQGTVIPEDNCLPEDVAQIANVQRIFLKTEWEKTFEAVFAVATRVNRGNLWAGARKWLQENRNPGGRFAGMDICESILPNSRRESHPQMPVYVHGEEGENRDLFSAIGDIRGHVFLIGQGGIGKTTALMHIMDKAYGRYDLKNSQIPIFVDLSFAPDTYGKLYSTEVASFIRRSVYRQIRRDLRVKQISKTAVDELDEIFTITPDVAVKPVNDLFSLRTDAPEYLLLLDGLNEVSQVVLENSRSVREMVVGEISYLMRFCPNVRVVLTSRTDEVDIGGNGVTRLYLSGVDMQTARNYLLTRGMEEKQVEAALQNQNLAQTLSIPLFLTMYAYLSKGEDALSQGEILRLFFHERSQDLEIYTAQNRVRQTDENLRNAASSIQRSRLDGEILRFVLDFVLPEIAWYMERCGAFYLSVMDIVQVLTPLLTGAEEIDFCGLFGRAAFADYRKAGSARSHVYSVATRLCTVMGEGDRKDYIMICENLLTCCVGTFGVLHENQAKYGFIHQHIRDYFAAVRIINTLRLALYIWEQGENDTAVAVMSNALREKPLGMTVRRFTGEYLGEHRNHPVIKDGRGVYAVPEEPCDRNVIDRVLNIYRGRFEGEVGCGVYSLLKMLVEVRGALAGCNLSKLDLTGCQLNSTRLSIAGLAAKIEGSRFNSRELFYYGHTKPIVALDFNLGEDWLLSASEDGKVCIWDTKTGILCQTFTVEGKLCYAGFNASGKQILTVSWGRTGRIIGYNWRDDYAWILRLWDIGTGQRIRREMLQAREAKFAGCPNRKRLLAWMDSHFWVIDTERLKPVIAECVDEDWRIHAAGFAGNGKLLLHFRSMLDLSKTRTEMRCIDESAVPIVLAALEDCEVKSLSGLDREICAIIKKDNDVEAWLVSPDGGNSRTICREGMGIIGEMPGAHFSRYSDQEKWLAVCLKGVIFLFERKNCRQAQPEIGEFITKCVFHDGMKRFAWGSGAGDVHVIDTEGFLPVFSVDGTSSEIEKFLLSPDGKYAVVGCSGGSVKLWDIQNRCCTAHWNGDGQGFSFSHDGCYLAVVSSFRTQVMSIPDMQMVYECNGTGTFAEGGRYFVNVRENMTDIYDASAFVLVRSISDAQVFGIVRDRALVKFQRRGKEGSQTVNLDIIDVQSGDIHEFLNEEATENITSERISFGGDLVAMVNPDGHLAVYNMHKEEKKVEIWDEKFKGSNVSVKMSADGKYVVINTGDLDAVGNTVIWSIETQQEIVDRQLYDGYMQCEGGGLMVEYMGGRRKHCQFSLLQASGGTLWTKVMDFRIPRQYHAMDREGKILMLRESADRLGIYKVSDYGAELQWVLEIEPGLELFGVDMRNVHPDVSFTLEQIRKLKLYGAILPEK